MSEKTSGLPDGDVLVVVSRFNEAVTRRLLDGAREALSAHGYDETRVQVTWVPGAFEIPMVLDAGLRTGQFVFAVALGAVIRGGTTHFEYVAGECTRGLTQVGLEFDLPVAFGVLTVDNEQQALERSGHGEGSENKGEESAAVVLEMISLLSRI